MANARGVDGAARRPYHFGSDVGGQWSGQKSDFGFLISAFQCFSFQLFRSHFAPEFFFQLGVGDLDHGGPAVGTAVG